MLIVDAHLDLAWNALQWNRNLIESAHTIRTREASTLGKARTLGTVALPDMRRGRLALCFATLLARATGHNAPHIDFDSPAQAYGIAKGQLAYYRALEREGIIRIVTDDRDLANHMAAWESWEMSGAVVADAPPLGFVISMESADPIMDPAQLAEWWQAGLRVLGPAHYGPGRYAGGTGTELGLTEIGPDLLAEMDRLGLLLDMTHFSDQAFWQAVDHYGGPVLASHNNCRALVAHQRQFSDDQLRLIIERDGVIGVALDAWMLAPGWIVGHTTNAQISLNNVVDHIDHICQLAGNCHHAAIGTDLDGGFGREQSPSDVDTIADLQKLPVILEERGYAEADIAAIMHGNWLRLLQSAWRK